MKPFERIRHIFVNAALILMTIGLTTVCFRWSSADITTNQIDYFLDTAFLKSISGTDADAEVWRKKRMQLEDILQSRPDNSLYYAQAERFYQKLDTLESYAPALINKLAWRGNEQKALDYVRTALQIRPSSAFLWKEVALSDVALKQYGKELDGALERAVSLDGWNKELLFMTIKLGLDHWGNIDESAQRAIMQAMEHLLAIDEQLTAIDKKKSINAALVLTALSGVKACLMDNQLKTSLPKLDAFCNAYLHS